MKSLIKHITAPWRKPTIEEMAQRELEEAKRTMFRAETMVIYYQNQLSLVRAVTPVLERKIREAREERSNA